MGSVGVLPWVLEAANHHTTISEDIMYSLMIARTLIEAFKTTAQTIHALRLAADTWAGVVDAQGERDE